MKKPDFFIVGAAKAGTTSLFNYLIQHPSVFVPSMKEPHFFSDYKHAHAPRLSGVDDYMRLFDRCRDDQMAGDLSTSYLPSASAADRIRAFQPRAKIVIVLRNPIDRAYSFYCYNRNGFVEDLSFEEALDREPQRIAEGTNFRFHYVESGRYSAQVKRFFEAFGGDAVRIYLFEDLVRDTIGVCKDIASFLGLPWDDSIRTAHVFNRSGVYKSKLIGRALALRFPGRQFIRNLAPNEARKLKARLFAYNTRRPPEMSGSTRMRLVAAFRDDIEQLSVLLNRDLSHWLEAPRKRPLRAETVETEAALPGSIRERR